jgi:hypothetical protein
MLDGHLLRLTHPHPPTHPARPRRYFEPEYWSLVQHVGRSSTLFGASKSNWKFTHAPMFDFDEKFVADDPPHMWF